MNLSSKTSDSKLYSRNKYSDGLPISSDDLHQDRDLTLRKLGLLMNSLVGSGLLEKLPLDIISKGIDSYSVRISRPTAVNLNGEVFLVGNSDDTYIVDVSKSFEGSLVLVCWYTNVTSNSDIYEYGGLKNKVLVNDMMNEKLGIQTSSRYQVRWDVCLCSETFDYANPSVKNITLVSDITTEAGVYSNITLNSSNMSITDKFYTLPATSKIPSADNLIHVLPLANIMNSDIIPHNVNINLTGIESTIAPPPTHNKVWYNPEDERVKMFFNGEWRSVGGSTIIKSEEEPTGRINEGTIWYDTNIGEFRIYIDGLGFVDTYAKMGFVQLQATHTFLESIASPQNITISIPIDTYLSSDLLRVSYEGVELIKGDNYYITEPNKTITLTDFTVNSGDKILFTLTRLVGSSDLMTTLTLLEDHINDLGNSSAPGHLKLTDTPSKQLDQSTGVAATPKSVQEVKDKLNKLHDSVNDITYELGVNNGLLFIREVIN